MNTPSLNEWGVTKIVEPGVGSRWADSNGRILEVTAVDLKDRQMSHVKGIIDGNEFSCTLESWARVWRDKTPPADRRQMTHG